MIYECEQRVFCANPDCELGLHVAPGDAGVTGAGNWAEINGRIWIGRSRVDNQFFCDACRVHVSSTNEAVDP